MGKTKISKETWLQVFSLKNYSDFVKEWLDLYDAFMSVNPPINKHTEFECLKGVTKGLLVKTLDHCNNNDERMELFGLLQGCQSEINSIVFMEGVESNG